MPSTFFGLNIGVSGLFNYQGALNTTGHNVANAGTNGYTRQKLIQHAGDPISVYQSYGMVGTGVVSTDIIQTRDIYYDVKYWKNNTISGEYNTKFKYMSEIENYYNDISLEGFNKIFDSMFGAIHDLSKDPSDDAARINTATIAGSLTDYFNEMSNQLKSVQEETNFEIKNQVDKINSISEQVAALNKQINMIEIGGENANDLRDQRALLVDELSNIGTVKVEEHKVGLSETGVSSYRVTMDGRTLVDNESVRKLEAVARKDKKNMNDVDGLYDIKWEDGSDFNIASSTLGGTLTALFQVRDGNNGENFTGNAVTGSTVNDAGGKQANKKDSTKLVLDNTSITSINKLNIPPSGTITVGNQEYAYNSFTVNRDAAGNVTYEFDLKEKLKGDVEGSRVKIDENINYKGIPHYMAKMNEFVRTFSSKFNELHNQGEDLNGDAGLDFFNGTDAAGNNFNLAEDPDTFNSSAGSYYLMNAGNFTVTKAIADNPRMIAATGDIENGVGQSDILQEIIKLKTDKSMFKQGTPYSFMHTIVAEIGVDTEKAENFSKSQDNIMASITNQRLSVSGVDKEEEAMDLIKFKNAYDLSAKVVSVMNEILNKLINQMGV